MGEESIGALPSPPQAERGRQFCKSLESPVYAMVFLGESMLTNGAASPA